MRTRIRETPFLQIDQKDYRYICVCVCREQGQRSEESSPSLRHKPMKPSNSQQSFDSAILDGSLPDENLSIDSDLSDNFVVVMDSGA